MGYAYPGYCKFDERDQSILDKRQQEYLDKVGPVVGHYVDFPNGITRRISYVWDWGEPTEIEIQTSNGGSWYLGNGGYVSFSGGLYRSVPFTSFRVTDELRDGLMWFFHHNEWGAYRGVHFKVPCPVWICRREAPGS